MTRLLDYTPLAEVRFNLAAAGGVAAPAPPAGATHYLVKGRMGAAAPYDPLDDQVRWSEDHVAPAEVGPVLDGARNTGQMLPGPLLVVANICDVLHFVNNDPLRPADIWLQWYRQFDPTGTSLMQLGGQPQWFNRQPELPFLLAPAAQIDFDRAAVGGLPVGTTHVIVAVIEVAGMVWRNEYYDAVPALQHAEDFTNAAVALADQANYLRAQWVDFRVRIINTGAVQVAGVVYPLIQK